MTQQDPASKPLFTYRGHLSHFLMQLDSRWHVEIDVIEGAALCESVIRAQNLDKYA
jgi:hypothetical protein